jgi:DNA-binding transcriptional regulator YiaG
MATYQEQIANAKRAKEAKAKAEAERAAQELSPEQVKNWREALALTIGPYAHVMHEDYVRALHAAFRERLKAISPSDIVQPEEKP